MVQHRSLAPARRDLQYLPAQGLEGLHRIEGRLTQRKYTDKNGVERTSVDVIASDMEMLTPKGAQGSSGDFLDRGIGESDPLDSEEFP